MCSSFRAAVLLSLLAAGALHPVAFPVLGKGVAAAADLVEKFGGAAGVAAQAGANVTAATADVLITLTTGEIATLREVWSGVDVH